MKNSFRLFGCAVLGAALLAGCAAPPPSTPELLGRIDQVLRGASNASAIAIQPLPAEIRTGDAIALEVVPRTAGYLYVYQVGTDGRTLSLLFPNAIDGANYVNTPLRLPRANWRIVARGPQGVGYFLAVLAEQPQDLNQQAAGVRDGQVAIAGRYAAAMAQLRELP
jgi:hypothetical protein